MEILKTLAAEGCLRAELVGSRVTCNPAPTDTDQDILVLVGKHGFDDLCAWACDEGYTLDGSEVEDYFQLSPEDTFQSLSNGEINFIVTEDPGFFDKFMLATHVAKTLNVMQKEHRIVLFQAILYGNKAE